MSVVSFVFWKIFGNFAPQFPEKKVLRGWLFDLWLRLKGVAGPEYARLNTGASITRENRGNGALLTRESGGGKAEDVTRQTFNVRE